MDLDTHETKTSTERYMAKCESLMWFSRYLESKFWTKKFGPIRPICISNHFCLFNQSVYKKYSMYNLPFTIINRKVRHQKSIKSSEWHLTFWKIIKSDSNAGWNQNTVNSKNMSDKFEAAFAKADADGSGSIGKFHIGHFCTGHFRPSMSMLETKNILSRQPESGWKWTVKSIDIGGTFHREVLLMNSLSQCLRSKRTVIRAREGYWTVFMPAIL